MPLALLESTSLLKHWLNPYALIQVNGNFSQEYSSRRRIGHFGLVHQEDRDAVSHGVNSATGSALQGTFVVGELQRLAALRERTYQHVKQLLNHHGGIVKEVCGIGTLDHRAIGSSDHRVIGLVMAGSLADRLNFVVTEGGGPVP
jgi:hypothetical protein